MATSLGSAPADQRRGMASPRPKGRENARNTACRNIGIYGFCRYEKDGCVYNHETAHREASPHGSAIRGGPDNATTKNRFNVDSPSFTPLQPRANGFESARPSAISPKSANAAPFTPKTNKPSPLSSNAQLKSSAPEWRSQEFPEFVPQNFDPAQFMAQGDAQAAAGQIGAYDPYSLQSAVQGLPTTPQPTITNPYLQDTTGNMAGAAYYQNSSGFAQPLQYHLYAPVAPYRENLLAYQRTTHDFFMPEDIREEYQRKAEATLQTLPTSSLPLTVDHFHSLVPLDISNQKNPSLFDYSTWIYKAVSSKDGKVYALRRLEGYRLTNELAIRAMQPWKRIDNANIVTVHDAFTTRAFGDSSLIFVTDYHPCSKTFAEQHFQSHGANRFGTTDRYGNALRGANPQHIPESTLWGYIVQVAAALKTIHSAGLAAQAIHPTKVLITSKNRIRLNACGVLDVVKFDASQAGVQRSQLVAQQDDFLQFGRLLLSVATGSLSVYTGPHNALDGLSRSYTERLRECIGWLLAPSQTQQPKDIDFLLSAISTQTMTVLDSTLHASDSLESVLGTSLEDGRVARLLLKLNLILERPEHDLNPRWSETGERYYIKLFRDYVFHAVDAAGHPNTDLSHILGCLNRLDVGSEERIMLTSRDGSTCFVVSFKDIKRAVESAWTELLGSNGAVGKGRK